MKSRVRAAIDATLDALKAQGLLSVHTIPPYLIDVPKQASHGDWASNVALVLSKVESKRPAALAALIIGNLVDPNGIISNVTSAGPGFLNFILTASAFQQVALDVLKAGPQWGRRAPNSTGRKVVVEFVSANPTGPIHIGHARSAFVGDAIVRLLEASGDDVTREFFINDAGRQVEMLGRSIYRRYQQRFGMQVQLSEDDEYPAAYVTDIAKAWQAQAGSTYLNRPESEWLPQAIERGVQANLRAIRSTLKKAAIEHDVFVSEANLHATGKVRGIVDVYKARGVTYQALQGRRRVQGEKVRSEASKAAQYAPAQKGGTFLMTATYQENGEYVLPDDEDRVLLRHDDSPVYLTADLAYHKDKFDRRFDLIVDVFGADHAGHVPRLQSGMKLLGYDAAKLRCVLVQMVRITQGGEEVKISKRKGTVYALEDLLEDAGTDVCRFIFLMKTPNAQFDFDLEEVKRQSKDNPVFYLQYGHARCASILKKAQEAKMAFIGPQRLRLEQLSRLVLQEEKEMLKKMSLLEEVVVHAAQKLEPHHVLYYCRELIADFHSYYTRHKVIERTDVNTTQARLALVAALQQTLQNAFHMLGITAPESM